MTALPNNLQPLSMSQLLDRAIRLYRNNFLLFVGIVAIAQIPATAVNMVGLWLAPTPEFGFDPAATVTDIWLQTFESMGFGNNPWVWLGRLVTLLLVQLATAAMTKAVAENYLGHKIGLFDAYRKIGLSGFTLLLATFIGIFFIIALFIWWVVVPCLGWLTGLGMIFFFGLVVLPLVAPVIVLEKRGAMAGLQRAWDLARRRFWWLIGFMLLLGLFGQLIVTGPALLSVFIVESTVGSGLDTTTTTLVQQVIGLLLNLIYLPLQLSCVTLLYFDVRVRTEGFDLALLALSEEANAETLAMTAPALDSKAIPKWEEMGYFALIEVAIIVLYVALVLGFIVLALGIGGL
ncbi:hypothetical protein [Candidatus Leptofilum sp.]|uniref:hypothetical protein n=1 Tax=Candidatus Leptofilum sp. TaxID=3241576 RepID=UPI003B5AF742